MAKATTEPGELRATIMTALLSLMLGLAVWVVVKQKDTQNLLLNVPVRPEGVSDLIELELDPPTIPVLFSFPKSEAGFMQTENFWVVLDLRNIEQRAGVDTATSDREQVTVNDIRAVPKVPGSVVPISLPQSNRVTWKARVRSREVAISPTVIGNPAAGFRVEKDQIAADPARVRVALTREREVAMAAGRKPLGSLVTAPVNIEGRNALVSEGAEIDFAREEGVFPMPVDRITQVAVRVPIVEEELTRTFDAVPFVYEPISREFIATVDPPVVPVTVTGPRSIVSGLTAADLLLSAPGVIEQAGQSSVVPLYLTIPERRRQGKALRVETTQKTVNVRIERRPNGNGAGTEGNPEPLPAGAGS